MISDERLTKIARGSIHECTPDDAIRMAREMLAQNCAARRPGRDPYELNEYIALLIRKDAAELAQRLEALAHQQCGKCKEQLPVQSCPCQGEAACWATSGWHEVKLTV